MSEEKIDINTIDEIDENDRLVDTIGQYINTRIDILKLRGVKTSSEVVSSLITYAVLLVFGLVLFLILNIAFGFFLGEKLGSNWLGFLAVSGIYLVLIIILIVMKNKIFKRPIANALINKLNA